MSVLGSDDECGHFGSGKMLRLFLAVETATGGEGCRKVRRWILGGTLLFLLGMATFFLCGRHYFHESSPGHERKRRWTSQNAG